jgi:hypothetical protein
MWIPTVCKSWRGNSNWLDQMSNYFFEWFFWKKFLIKKFVEIYIFKKILLSLSKNLIFRKFLEDTARNQSLLKWFISSQFFSIFFFLFAESLIARFSIQGELGVSANWTQYPSRQATKEIEFEYRVTCESNYYGAGCETLCRERDDNFGHYACSASGQRMCFSGWQGDYCTKRKCSRNSMNEILFI